MEWDLKGRKVLVTGCGEGIGRAVALAFGEAGARVAGCARTEPRLHALEREMSGAGHFFQTIDVTLPEQLKDFHDKVLEQLGGLDVLVNNVGAVGKLADFHGVDDQDWRESFELNLLPAVRLCRLFIPTLKHSGAPRIINISSIAGSRPGEIFPHYSAMKAALSNFTVSLAQTLAPEHILVNSVSPGPVWTRSWEQEAEASARQSGKHLHEAIEELRTTTGNSVPLKRMGMPEDVAGLVLFLASDHASWITATNFPIDGGITQNPY
ncbi:MAG: SDR family oxidoreductase [Nitrospinaceae bacterium]|nr:SDR family oxidoreductase [Nitrospinaceae bacterium]NIR56961.1 SDR family oxidoreductase [Nitrospinaceae bacterium]NIS87418.1 SDR family oxidoreductase [Nitrospinaceae bacterium]NIT84270.1 SDR family oxidoreductase [Nitrospinaceae bacterium]NIU46457.1 SDR family oxidoreductase [Nitrospinaceae bacterium]